MARITNEPLALFKSTIKMALMFPESVQTILHGMNTNVDGQRKICYALTDITGVDRRYSTVVCKETDVDLYKRAGEHSEDEVENLITV